MGFGFPGGHSRRPLAGFGRDEAAQTAEPFFLLPLYALLICYAAWMAAYDLLKRPQHWHKTEHGLARSSRRAAAEQRGG